MTLVKEIELPVITDTQRVAFGILCALEVSTDSEFVEWANKWLSGEDRTYESARKMYQASSTAEMRAAEGAARAAMADWGAEAARAVAWAAEGAAAWAAVVGDKNLDLISLAEKCLKYE